MAGLRYLLLMPIFVATAAGAATTPLNVKPGLWEMTMQIDPSGMPGMPGMPQIPQAVLDAMPPDQRANLESMLKSPEQRAKFESMLKSQQSQFNSQLSKREEERICLTKADLNQPFTPDDTKQCTHRVISSTGSKMEIEALCTLDGGVKTTVSARHEALSPERVTSIVTTKTEPKAPGDGRPMTMTSRMNARWLGADCGEVKPVGSSKSP